MMLPQPLDLKQPTPKQQTWIIESGPAVSLQTEPLTAPG